MPHRRAKGISEDDAVREDIDHFPIKDPTTCLDMVRGHFQEKWGGADHQSNGFIDMLYNHEPRDITQKEICTAIEGCKKANRLDHLGLCPFALSLAFVVDPQGWAKLFNKIANEKQELTQVEIKGPAKAKKKGTIMPADARTLLPQPAIVQVWRNVLVGRIIDPIIWRELRLWDADRPS
jgi:hypothetical protein